MFRLLYAYNGFLNSSPNISNTLSAGAIGALGDGLAQKLEHIATGDHQPINWTRTAYCAGFGLLTGAPLIQWFRFLERTYGTKHNASTVAKKVITNQLICSPSLTAFFYVYINICQHYKDGYEAVKQNSITTLKREFVPSMITSSFYWPTVQTANFFIVPLHFRAVWNSVFAAGWNCFVSFRGHSK
eukprot:TRINITY_DN13193_c0_g1_i1.p1 TRINITY_DN13193_c0_g1~~TRINITY_DN13193_c0_g1_i1.p1  ORF type:complete len:186 (-),score=21.14 TRINITY_DN13193_c0_g1_i1:22-579(-)